MKVKYVVYIILIFYFILIFVKNNVVIRMDAIFKEFHIPLYLFFIFAFLLGSIASAIPLLKKLKQCKKKLKEISK